MRPRAAEAAAQKSESSIGRSTVGSSGGGSLGSKTNNRLSAKQAVANGVRCAYKRYQQTRNISFPKNDLSRLKEVSGVGRTPTRPAETDREREPEQVLRHVLQPAERGGRPVDPLPARQSRGKSGPGRGHPLQDVLFNEELKISRNFQISFAKDVVKGLNFLHTSTLKYHGMLCIQNCLVDSNWTVKLTNFLTEEIIGDKLRHNELKLMVIKVKKEKKKGKANGKDKDKDKDEDESDSSEEEDTESKAMHHKAMSKSRRPPSPTPPPEYIQQAPEVIREIITTKFIPQGTQAADMYSLGMVLYQILFKLEPFYERNQSPSSRPTPNHAQPPQRSWR